MKKNIIGTTSFIFPAGVGENCKRLEGIVDEVSIVLFETRSCLTYTEEDLPLWLSTLNLSYDIHLPLDLPWDRGIQCVVDIIVKLIDKTLFLSPTYYVLHPPSKANLFVELISNLEKKGISLEKFLIENIKENDLSNIWDLITSTGLNVCLDIGHLMEYHQYSILRLQDIYLRTKMLHLYAPENGMHRSLSLVDGEEKKFIKEIFHKIYAVSDTLTVILEVFKYKDLLESLDFLESLCRE